VDYDDYTVIFDWLNSAWPPHMIDKFANPLTSQLVRFNSRFYTQGSEAIDVFTCDWSGENNWWFPPVYLVPRLFKHAQSTKVFGTLNSASVDVGTILAPVVS